MKLLDVVALTEDFPEKSLTKGQVGTIVEQLTLDVFEVEFSGLDGKTYATAAVPANRLIRLIHEPPHKRATRRCRQRRQHVVAGAGPNQNQGQDRAVGAGGGRRFFFAI